MTKWLQALLFYDWNFCQQAFQTCNYDALFGNFGKMQNPSRFPDVKSIAPEGKLAGSWLSENLWTCDERCHISIDYCDVRCEKNWVHIKILTTSYVGLYSRVPAYMGVTIWSAYYVPVDSAIHGFSQRMFQHRSVLQCAAVPTQLLHGQFSLLCTKCNFLQFWVNIFIIKMWGDSRFTFTDRYFMIVKLCPIKSKVNLPLKITSYSVSNLCLSHGFQWLLLTATMVEIEIAVVYAMHYGQDLIHPLTHPWWSCSSATL